MYRRYPIPASAACARRCVVPTPQTVPPSLRWGLTFIVTSAAFCSAARRYQICSTCVTNRTARGTASTSSLVCSYSASRRSVNSYQWMLRCPKCGTRASASRRPAASVMWSIVSVGVRPKSSSPCSRSSFADAVASWLVGNPLSSRQRKAQSPGWHQEQYTTGMSHAGWVDCSAG
jgi:hypothetical protein